MGPVSFHFLISDVLELFFVHMNHSRAYRSVLHLASMFARAQPPCSLGSCSVVTGTRCTQLSVFAGAPWWVGEFVPDTKFSREDIGVHIVFVVRGRGFEQRLFLLVHVPPVWLLPSCLSPILQWWFHIGSPRS